MHDFFVQITFGPQAGFLHRLSHIAESVSAKYDMRQWASTGRRFDFVQDDNLLHVGMDHQSVTIRVRTRSQWESFKASKIAILTDVVGGYDLKSVSTLKLQSEAMLDLEMSHSEMSELGFESSFKSPFAILEQANDWSLTLAKALDGSHVRLDVSPMTVEMAVQHCQASFDAPVTNLWKTNLGSLTSSITSDRLFVRVTQEQKETSKHDIVRLLTLWDAKASDYCERVVKRITNQA